MVSATFNTGAFTSRRSPVMAPSAMAATAQPLATAAALGVLMEGGNAVDAAIAAAAVLGVTEPYQTGLGGDAFALLYFAETGQVRALNASGPAPLAATPAAIRARGHEAVPEKGPLSWTVPGCVDGWCQMAEAHGSMDLARILRPAIRYAADGFPVSPVDARAWAENESLLHRDPGASRHLLIEGRAPRAGEMLRQPVLAQTLERLAAGGRDAFYEGPIAHSIAAHSAQQGGLLSLADLAAYRAEWQEPISLAYRGHQIMQCPPNGQGIAALLALRSLDLADFPVLPREGPACMHLLIEAIKRAMAAASVEVADPRFSPTPTRFDTPAVLPGAEVWDSPFYPPGASDTVFIAVVDAAGNAVSFINSVYGSFGSGSVVDALGFALQNRAFGMSMDTAHPNCIAPGKRPLSHHYPGPGPERRQAGCRVRYDGRLHATAGTRAVAGQHAGLRAGPAGCDRPAAGMVAGPPRNRHRERLPGRNL